MAPFQKAVIIFRALYFNIPLCRTILYFTLMLYNTNLYYTIRLVYYLHYTVQCYTILRIRKAEQAKTC